MRVLLLHAMSEVQGLQAYDEQNMVRASAAVVFYWGGGKVYGARSRIYHRNAAVYGQNKYTHANLDI